MTPMSPRLSAAERAEMMAVDKALYARMDDMRIDCELRCASHEDWRRFFELACLGIHAADREADAIRLANEIAELRAECDRLAADLADREKDVGRAWIAGRDAAHTQAVEYRDEQAEYAIDTEDDEAARLHAARAVAGNTIRTRIAALTPPTATLTRPCAHPCQWMPNADPAGAPRICAHCGREEPGPGATRATDGMEDGDG